MDDLIAQIAEGIWTERQPTASTPWSELPDGTNSMRNLHRRMARAALNALKAAGYEVVRPELGKLSADWLAQAQRYPEATAKFAADLLLAAAKAAEAVGDE